MSDSVAVIAAHPDDEVLGCGGTIARMAKQGRAVHVLLLADGETSRGGEGPSKIGSSRIEARKAMAERACRVLGLTSVEVQSFPDNRLDSVDLLDIVRQIERLLDKCRPSTVLTHHIGDVNVDHRVVHEAVLAACRPLPGRLIEDLLFFEVPSSTEWTPAGSAAPFVPNYFVDISSTLEMKLNALLEYDSELRAFPHPRSARAVEALARWRGATAGLESAEAFIIGRRILA